MGLDCSCANKWTLYIYIQKTHMLGQAVNEQERQQLRAEAMDCKRTATASRMNLKRVVVNLPEAVPGIAALRASNAGARQRGTISSTPGCGEATGREVCRDSKYTGVCGNGCRLGW